MAKEKKLKEEAPAEEPKADVESAETPKAEKKPAKAEYPEIAGNGKFQIVPFAEGFLLYNPDGVRVSGVETEAKAKDLANRMNVSIGLK